MRSSGEVTMPARIAIIGALDTKGAELAYPRDQIQALGAQTLVIDVGVAGQPLFPPDITSAEVARAAGADLEQLRAAHDRGEAMATMGRGAAALVRRLHA